ncbi:DUF6778 family protein [Sediminimonas sp.]|jgi:hypothetical protein|uniref:DUF6778 family protein n=1 Tax=Sediminimonas sp. TaxID=2823379 RepID=UPI0025D462ED|nr:DUF6778 family protein [Sediminimonas sp.]
MAYLRTLVALCAGLGLTACASIETATRNAPLEAPGLSAAAVEDRAVSVASYQVKVSRELRVSEANSYYPFGDIVWRGDPIGDRHAQVAAILDAAMAGVAEKADGSRAAVVEIELQRFHALTEKTRYTIGGVHSVKFTLTLRDPETGAPLMEPRTVKADLKAYGGSKALAAERDGLTQKVRITRHLENVIRQELVAPGSAPRGVTDRVAGLETGDQIGDEI